MLTAGPSGIGMDRPLPQTSTRPLLAGLLVMVLLMCAGMGLGIYQLRYMSAALDQVVLEDDAARQTINTMLRTSRNRMLMLIEATDIADPFDRDAKLLDFEQRASRFGMAQQRLSDLSNTEAERRILNQQKAQMAELVSHLDRIVELAHQGQLVAARNRIHSLAIPAQSRMLDSLLLWVETHDAVHGQQVKALQLQQRKVVRMMVGVTLFSVLIGLLVTMWVTRWNRRIIARFTDNETQQNAALSELALLKQAMDAHSIVSVANADGNITHVNDKFCDVSGYRREELIGSNHRIVKSDFHPPEFFREMWDTISNGHIWHGEVKNRSKTGLPYWVETTIVPRLDQNGLPMQYISVRTEITNIMEMEEAVRQANIILRSNVVERTHELEQAKQQLEQELFDRVRTQDELQKSYDELAELHRELQTTQQHLMHTEKLAAVGQLAAGMAHEINNPIGFVSSNLTTLQRYQATLNHVLACYQQLDSKLDEASRSAIVATRQAADLDYLLEDSQGLLVESLDGVERIRKIIQSLRDFARVDQSEQWQWVDMSQCLDTTLKLMGDRLTQEIDIHREYSPSAQVECNPADLNQVFISLLSNALKAMQGRGSITLRCGQSGEQAWVEIEDTGVGMSERVRTHVFDPFFTTRPIGQGVGLGLSMAYGIIQKHGGAISVSSEEGIGTVFRIVLPLSQANRADSSQALNQTERAA